MNQNQFKSLMLFLPALVIAPLNTSYALSPQQYCESLEKKSPDSFEILNLEGGRMEGAVPITSTFEKSLTIYSLLSFEVCENHYGLVLDLHGRTHSLRVSNPNYPICAAAGPGVSSTAIVFNGNEFNLPHAGDFCLNIAGYNAKNGN